MNLVKFKISKKEKEIIDLFLKSQKVGIAVELMNDNIKNYSQDLINELIKKNEEFNKLKFGDLIYVYKEFDYGDKHLPPIVDNAILIGIVTSEAKIDQTQDYIDFNKNPSIIKFLICCNVEWFYYRDCNKSISMNNEFIYNTNNGNINLINI